MSFTTNKESWQTSIKLYIVYTVINSSKNYLKHFNNAKNQMQGTVRKEIYNKQQIHQLFNIPKQNLIQNSLIRTPLKAKVNYIIISNITNIVEQIKNRQLHF